MPDTEGAFHAITTDSDSAMSEYICVLLEGQLTGTTVKRITGHTGCQPCLARGLRVLLPRDELREKALTIRSTCDSEDQMRKGHLVRGQ